MSSQAHSYVSTGNWRAGASKATAPSMLAKVLVWAFFAATVAVSIYGVRLMVAGIPVRSIIAILGLLLTLGIDRGLAQATFREHPRTLITIAAFALLGALVSTVNGQSPALIGRQLIEIHLQAAIGLMLAKGVVRICGFKAACWTFVVVVGLSALVAALQFAGINAAWQARKALGVPQGDGPLTQIYYTRRDRAMGLSYSPVHLATQTCLAFAAFYAMRLRSVVAQEQRIDVAIIVAVIVSAAACFVSGNRSPLLGLVAFSFIYFYAKSPKLFWIAAPLALGSIPLFMALMQALAASGARVASTDDGSALGRIVLSSYGWRLFLERPTGYGLGFQSTNYWADYWEYFEYYANAYAIRTYAVHNYFLQILNKYGIGALLAGVLVFPRRQSDFRILLPFIAYIVHITFHNDGPMQGDFLIWYVFAMFPVAPTAPAQGVLTGPGSWRYAAPGSWGPRTPRDGR